MRTVPQVDPVSGETINLPILPPSKFTLNVTAGAQTAALGDMTGAADVQVQYTLVGAAALTTRTALQLIADLAAVGLGVGDSFTLSIINSNAGTITLTAGVGVTITGTATIATTVVRKYVVTITSATTVTFQAVSASTQ